MIRPDLTWLGKYLSLRRWVGLIPIPQLIDEEIYATQKRLLDSEAYAEEWVAECKMLRDRLRRLQTSKGKMPKAPAP